MQRTKTVVHPECPIPFQKPLFTYICSEEGHNFSIVGEGYYKTDTNGEAIKGKVYRTILCSKCGEFKEICIVDRTAAKASKVVRTPKRKKS